MKRRLHFEMILLMFLYGCAIQCHAQSGFSFIHGDMEGVSYTGGSLFYRQYASEIKVSEGVEQSYLLTDTIMDDGCVHVAYDGFGFSFGDTLEEGFYSSRKYIHTARYGYDSLVVHHLWVYPSTTTYDTLLLAEADLGSYAVGENVDSLYSSHGCDSVVFRMVYVVVCPADYVSTAPYGVSEVSPYLEEPFIIPSVEEVSVSSDAPPLLSVGTPAHISWMLAAGTDTFYCFQNVLVDYPPCGDGFTAEDGDGNVYETVRIGADCWLRQNIYATHYAGTGDTIPVANVFHADVFPDTASNVLNFGRLYSWYSAVGLPENSSGPPPSNAEGEVQGVCPVGWHLPTSAELAALRVYGSVDLKATGDLWIGEPPTDMSHLSIVPGGLYNSAQNRYENLRTYAFLWLSDSNAQTEACAAYLRYVCSELDITCFAKTNECSVRCAKD